MIPTTRAFRRRKIHKPTWRRRWRVLVLDLLGREESLERVAAAIGLGVAIGFSPFVGIHFVLALSRVFVIVSNTRCRPAVHTAYPAVVASAPTEEAVPAAAGRGRER